MGFRLEWRSLGASRLAAGAAGRLLFEDYDTPLGQLQLPLGNGLPAGSVYHVEQGCGLIYLRGRLAERRPRKAFGHSERRGSEDAVRQLCKGRRGLRFGIVVQRRHMALVVGGYGGAADGEVL